MEEQIDVYDANRQPLGYALPRKGTRLQRGQFMLYALGVVQNAQGKYLITQRALDKSWGAGWWEIPGGGVLSGETTQQAVVREIGEETGLDVSGLQPELLYSYVNEDTESGDNYIVDIFRFVLDFSLDQVELQQREATACALVDWEDIVSLHEQGIFLHFARLQKALGKAQA